MNIILYYKSVPYRLIWCSVYNTSSTNYYSIIFCMLYYFVYFCSGRHKRKLPPSQSMPSRWYTLLALPFPDQQVGRREFSRAYRSRAGYFSNPI